MDKQKVSEYLKQVEVDYLLSASDFDRGIIYQVRRIQEALDRGEFDPTPSPTIKPGDKVRHKTNNKRHTGFVRFISLCGRGAIVMWSESEEVFTREESIFDLEVISHD